MSILDSRYNPTDIQNLRKMILSYHISSDNKPESADKLTNRLSIVLNGDSYYYDGSQNTSIPSFYYPQENGSNGDMLQSTGSRLVWNKPVGSSAYFHIISVQAICPYGGDISTGDGTMRAGVFDIAFSFFSNRSTPYEILTGNPIDYNFEPGIIAAFDMGYSLASGIYKRSNYPYQVVSVSVSEDADLYCGINVSYVNFRSDGDYSDEASGSDTNIAYGSATINPNVWPSTQVKFKAYCYPN